MQSRGSKNTDRQAPIVFTSDVESYSVSVQITLEEFIRMGQTAQQMQVVIHAGDRGSAFMHCPQCGASKKISTSSYRLINKAAGIELTCPACNHKYKVLINYRKFYRKKTNLKGIYTIATANIDHRFDFDTTSVITIGNISRTGIGFKMKNTINVEIDDILKVKFILDDEKKSVVEKKAIVKRVDKDFIGAEFTRAIDYRDKALAFYLMWQ
jgi:transcription elongation factor Elf1